MSGEKEETHGCDNIRRSRYLEEHLISIRDKKDDHASKDNKKNGVMTSRGCGLKRSNYELSDG